MKNSVRAPSVIPSDDYTSMQLMGKFGVILVDLDCYKLGCQQVMAELEEEVHWFLGDGDFSEALAIITKLSDPALQHSYTIKDNLRESRVGYSSIVESPLLKPFREELFRYVMRADINTICRRTGRNLYAMSGGDVLFDQDEVSEFFSRIDQFVEVSLRVFSSFWKRTWLLLTFAPFQRLCGSSHLVIGAPPRGPEMASFTRVLNQEGYRSLTMVNNRVTFASEYHKSIWRTAGQKYNPHPLPPTATYVILVYETLILPLVEKLLHEQFSAPTLREVRDTYKNFLFVKRGVRFTESQVGRAVERVTFDSMGFKIGLAANRQLKKAIFTTFSNFDDPALGAAMNSDPHSFEDEETSDNAGTHAMHTAFGHTAATGEANYAVMSSSAPTARPSTYKMQMDVGIWMIDWLGLGRSKVTIDQGGGIVCSPSQNSVIRELTQVSRPCSVILSWKAYHDPRLLDRELPAKFQQRWKRLANGMHAILLFLRSGILPPS